ncbi:hypothetical protein KSP39_PZI003647 [Platanthera zijinensis]|uniref:Uncharacterized protein n=1 Tax=Platanthera zijinensis TaxID=2320716 RepID=A0AAP0BWS8_9ASPA
MDASKKHDALRGSRIVLCMKSVGRLSNILLLCLAPLLNARLSLQICPVAHLTFSDHAIPRDTFIPARPNFRIILPRNLLSRKP